LPAVADKIGVEAKGNRKNPPPRLNEADELFPVPTSPTVLQSSKPLEVEKLEGARTGSKTLNELDVNSVALIRTGKKSKRIKRTNKKVVLFLLPKEGDIMRLMIAREIYFSIICLY
jgi:hypothetical protein